MRKSKLSANEDHGTPAGHEDQRYRQELVRAMRRLARTPRTAAETKEHFDSRDLPENWVKKIIAELKKQGFLDDRRFALDYARARCERGYGENRIRTELANKGIDENLIDPALEAIKKDYDESEILSRVVSKRLRNQGEPQTEQELKNLSDFLHRRGFSPDSIRAELKEFFDNIFGTS